LCLEGERICLGYDDYNIFHYEKEVRMKEVKFEVFVQPDLLKFGFDQVKIQRSVNEWLVLSLFSDGVISSGKAAKLLGTTRIEFLDLLRRRGIAYLDYSPQEIEEELEAVKSLEINKP